MSGSPAVDGRPALELTEPTVTIEFEFQKHCTVGFLPDNSVVASSERIDAEDDSEFRGQDISNWPCCSPFITESLMGVGALVDRDDNTEGIIGGLRFVFSSDQTLVVDYRRFRGSNKSYLTHRVRFANDASLARWWCEAPWLEIPTHWVSIETPAKPDNIGLSRAAVGAVSEVTIVRRRRVKRGNSHESCVSYG